MLERVSITDPDDRSVPIVSRTSPSDDGPALLFLHGLAANASSFKEAGERLAELEARLLIPDLPGHGESTPNEDYPYTPDWYRSVLESFLQHLNAEPDAIIGHSMGGTIALLLAEVLSYQPRLVCIEGFPRKLDYLRRRAERYEQYDPPGRGYDEMLHEFSQSTDPGVQEWVKWAERTDPTAFFTSAREFAELWEQEDMLDRYRDYPADRRDYVCGGEGQYEYISDELPEDEVNVVPRAGHFPMVDQPDTFWSTVREVLNR